MVRGDGEIDQLLRKHVDVLAGLIGERNTNHPTALQATRAYLVRELVAMGLKPITRSYQTSAREAANIEVVVPGRDEKLPMLLVGAHYDTVLGTPGADDNASAVAILLELARAVAGSSRKRGIELVFYDCEEPPHYATGEMGSFEHARRLRKEGREILGMVCLESLGYWPNRVDDRVGRPALIRRLDKSLGGRFVVVVSNHASWRFWLGFCCCFATSGLIQFVPAVMRGDNGIHAMSDHRSYWEQAYPALMITNTAIFRNPNYHRPTDLPETLDYERMTAIARTLGRAIQRMCR